MRATKYLQYVVVLIMRDAMAVVDGCDIEVDAPPKVQLVLVQLNRNCAMSARSLTTARGKASKALPEGRVSRERTSMTYGEDPARLQG